MKKFMILGLFVLMGTYAHAFPVMNNTAGATPFIPIQQQNFVRTEKQHFKDFTDANDRSVESGSEDPEKIKQEYKIKELRRRAPKFNLNNYKVDPSEEYAPKQMQLKEEDGKIYIQGVN